MTYDLVTEKEESESCPRHSASLQTSAVGGIAMSYSYLTTLPSLISTPFIHSTDLASLPSTSSFALASPSFHFPSYLTSPTPLLPSPSYPLLPPSLPSPPFLSPLLPSLPLPVTHLPLPLSPVLQVVANEVTPVLHHRAMPRVEPTWTQL